VGREQVPDEVELIDVPLPLGGGSDAVPGVLPDAVSAFVGEVGEGGRSWLVRGVEGAAERGLPGRFLDDDRVGQHVGVGPFAVHDLPGGGVDVGRCSTHQDVLVGQVPPGA
jgi:hypothetical protein